MIRFTPALAAIAALPLMACAQTPPVEDASNEIPDQCGASKVADIVGKVATDQLTQDAQKRAGARTLRVIRPGQAVTMDYRVDRLNIELDAQDRVTTARCG